MAAADGIVTVAVLVAQGTRGHASSPCWWREGHVPSPDATGMGGSGATWLPPCPCTGWCRGDTRDTRGTREGLVSAPAAATRPQGDAWHPRVSPSPINGAGTAQGGIPRVSPGVAGPSPSATWGSCAPQCPLVPPSRVSCVPQCHLSAVGVPWCHAQRCPLSPSVTHLPGATPSDGCLVPPRAPHVPKAPRVSQAPSARGVYWGWGDTDGGRRQG